MHCLLISLCMLDLFYRSSPLADCKAANTESELGKWEADNHALGWDHGITQSGPVYAIDTRNLLIQKFVYDGNCNFGQFWLANTSDGADGTGNGYRLGPYDGKKDIVLTLTLPLPAFKYFRVWCKEQNRVFAYVKVPEENSFDPPQPADIGPFLNTKSGVEGNVTILDGRTFEIRGFSYDGAPNATFTAGIDMNMTTILPIEMRNGTNDYGPIPKYENEILRVKIPCGKTVCDYRWFAVYSHEARESLGIVWIPKDLRVPADHEQNDVDWTTTTTTMGPNETTTTDRPNSTTTTTQRTTTKSPEPRTTTATGFGDKALASCEVVFVATVLIFLHFYFG